MCIFRPTGTSEACIQTEVSKTPSLVVSATPRPLTPSTRIAALNLVGDLLQKVAVSLFFISIKVNLVYPYLATALSSLHTVQNLISLTDLSRLLISSSLI